MGDTYIEIKCKIKYRARERERETYIDRVRDSYIEKERERELDVETLLIYCKKSFLLSMIYSILFRIKRIRLLKEE